MNKFIYAVCISLSLMIEGCGTESGNSERTEIPATPSVSTNTSEASGAANNGVFFRAAALPDASGFTQVLSVDEYVINGSSITESSGIARSNIRPDIFWTFNDSGAGPVIFAVTDQGGHMANVSLNGLGVTNLDWEDIASFKRGSDPYILVGDVGDNNAFRPFVSFYLLREPSIDLSQPGLQNLVADVEGIFQVSFPGGPRDVEAVAVDGIENMAYVISKRDLKPTLYRFSLNSASPLAPKEPQLFEDLGAINIPRAIDVGYKGNAEDFNWVTSMDFDETGRRAYVGTLTHGYIFTRNTAESWKAAFQRKPFQFELPKYSQIEAGGFQKGKENTIFITSENVPARMAKIVLR